MNAQKIKLLSQQALDSVSNKRTVSGQLERTWNPDAYDQAFAQLIVRECVAICQDLDGEDNTDAKSGRQDCAVEIQEHFGVEQ